MTQGFVDAFPLNWDVLWVSLAWMSPMKRYSSGTDGLCWCRLVSRGSSPPPPQKEPPVTTILPFAGFPTVAMSGCDPRLSGNEYLLLYRCIRQKLIRSCCGSYLETSVHLLRLLAGFFCVSRWWFSHDWIWNLILFGSPNPKRVHKSAKGAIKFWIWSNQIFVHTADHYIW